jgi:hypothetical protein
MEKWFEKPLDFGDILTVTFRIFKQHFLKLFLVMILFTAPIYLLEWVVLFILPIPDAKLWAEGVLEKLIAAATKGEWFNFEVILVTLLVITVLLVSTISLLLARAGIILATDRIRRGESINIRTVIKQVFSRFWALLGGTAIYFLVVLTLLSGVMLINVSYFWFIGEDIGPIHIVLIVPLAGCYFLGVIYLLIRWSFHFAAIVFEKVSPGLSKSWQLTRGFFWRIFGLYIVYIILTSVISAIVQFPINLFLEGNILGQVLNDLITTLTTMFLMIGYAVVYFDLRIRSEEPI